MIWKDKKKYEQVNNVFYPRGKKEEDYDKVMNDLDYAIKLEIDKGNIHKEYYDGLSNNEIFDFFNNNSKNVDETINFIKTESKDFIRSKKRTNDLMKKGKGERGQIGMSEVWFPGTISFGPEYNTSFLQNELKYEESKLKKEMIDDFKKNYGGIFYGNNEPIKDKNGNEMACASDCKCSFFPCRRPQCKRILNSNKIPFTIEEKWTYCKSPSENKKTVGGAKKKKSKKKFKKRNYKKLKKRKTKKKMKFRKKTKKKEEIKEKKIKL